MGNRSGLLTACLLIFLAGCFLPLPALGQQSQGSVTGVHTHPSDSLTPDAQVAAAERETGAQLFQAECRSLKRVRGVLGLFVVQIEKKGAAFMVNLTAFVRRLGC